MSDDIDEIMMLLNSMPSGINKENPAEEALPEKNAPRKIAKMIEARPFVDLAFLFVNPLTGACRFDLHAWKRVANHYSGSMISVNHRQAKA